MNYVLFRCNFIFLISYIWEILICRQITFYVNVYSPISTDDVILANNDKQLRKKTIQLFRWHVLIRI